MSCILSKSLLYDFHKPKGIDRKAPAHSWRFSTFIGVIPIRPYSNMVAKRSFKRLAWLTAEDPGS